jgi:D-alanyl-lipoteichoic acid acyltransferase DltB (MBOAT superfamily)
LLFNSVEYLLLFLPAVVLLHFAAPPRWRWAVLLAASCVFYGRWSIPYLGLVFASTLVAYLAALAIARAESRRAQRAALALCLASMLGVLFAFKYWGFFASSAEWVLARLGVEESFGALDVLLPVGISFYTFQAIGYVVDVYRGLRPETHLGRFALFKLFFPQLVAGPIERANQLLPQLREERRFDAAQLADGLQLLLWGLFKKVVIADRLALYVDAVYGNVGEHHASTFVLATYAFAVQIYCDFSGYSDIAVGSARMLGIDLMRNFRRPYFATGAQDFWRRWHISLSSWLRDYLYIPLGGNRGGAVRTYANLFATMLLGGLWHGASWTFVVWGALHGGALALARSTQGARDGAWHASGAPVWLRDAWRGLVTFQFVCLCWVFFRAGSIEDALGVLASLRGPWRAPFLETGVLSQALPGVLLLLAVQLFQAWVGPVREHVRRLPLPVRWAGWYALLLGVVLLGVEGGSQFIYFQF